MPYTEQEYQELLSRIKNDLMVGSQGVGEVKIAETLEGITSLPAFQPVEGKDMPDVVEAPLTLLAAPALEASKKANEEEARRAAAESGRVEAENARVTEFGKIKTDSEKATGDANAAANRVDESIHNAEVATGEAQVATAGANQAAIGANQAASNADEKAILADAATANANDTANHPTYIGTDHYVYKWNKTTQAYDKTDIYCKGDAFSIKKVYASVAALNADVNNAAIKEGDFVLVNTNDVENPDNAKLYVKVKSDTGVYSYDFLVDMSGAIGFTGKTPQFSMGNISTLEAGSIATATVSEDGTDSDGNPKYKINFAIPRGNPGAPFRVTGEYATLAALQAAVPNGANVDGFMAVGTKVPYNYYAWVNGAWKDQGQIAGGGGSIVKIPVEVLSLSDSVTSSEIFNAFGSKKAYMEICQKVYEGDVVCVIANTPSDIQGMKLSYTPVVAASLYVDSDNANLQLSLVTETIMSFVIIVKNGVATFVTEVKNLLTQDDIVNDLTTGGTDRVLSADMGKQLNESKMDNLITFDFSPYQNEWNGNMSQSDRATFAKWVAQDIHPAKIEVDRQTFYTYADVIPVEQVFISMFVDNVDGYSGSMFQYTFGGDFSNVKYDGNFYLYAKNYTVFASNVSDGRSTLMDNKQMKQVIQSTDVWKLEKLTQAEYDALSTKDSSTLYIII